MMAAAPRMMGAMMAPAVPAPAPGVPPINMKSRKNGNRQIARLISMPADKPRMVL